MKATTTKSNTKLSLLATLAALAATPAFGQNLLVNGSFEADGQIGISIDTTPVTGFITGWTLATTSDSTDFVVFAAPGSNEPNPADGSYILNIGGFGTTKGVGNLYQDFATTAGVTYEVNYAYSRENNDPTPVDNVSMSTSLYDVVGGVPASSPITVFNSGDAPATPIGTADMTPESFSFTAAGSDSRIFIQDTSVSSGQSLELDAVSVTATATPEPGAASLLLLGGCTGAIFFGCVRGRGSRAKS